MARSSSSSRALSTTLAGCAFSGLVHASTLLVGPASSGAPFSDIQPAISAAASGDTVVVLPGFYTGFVVDKPLRIVGAGNDGFAAPTSATVNGYIDVLGIQAGAEVVLGGFYLNVGQLRVSANDGLVTVYDAQIGYALVDHTARLVVAKSKLDSLRVDTATAWVVDSNVHGGSGIYFGPCFGVPQLPPGTTGIVLENATLYVARSNVTGSAGNFCNATGLGINVYSVAGSAIHAQGSIVKDVGGPGSQLAAGSPTAASSMPAAVVLESGSAALINASVPLVSLGTPVVLDTASELYVVTTTYPTLGTSAPSAAPGSSVTLAANGNAQSLHVVLWSASFAPALVLGGIDGALALDPAQAQVLTTLVLGPAGAALRVLGVPADPALLGTQLALQSVELAGSTLAFGNPIVQAIAP